MKLSIACLAIVSAVVSTTTTTTSATTTTNTNTTVNDDVGPYKLTFFYKERPTSFSCARAFVTIADSVYQEMIHEMVFTRDTVEYSQIDKVDPKWFTVVGFNEVESRFPANYRVKKNIWVAPDEFDITGKYKLDAQYTDPTISDPIVVPDADRDAFAQPVIIPTMNGDGDDTTSGPGRRQRQLRGSGDEIVDEQKNQQIVGVVPTDNDVTDLRIDVSHERELQQVKQDCGFLLSVGRTYWGDCSVLAKDATGGKNKIDTLKPGSGAAQLFYENIDALLVNDPCKDILNAMTYAVSKMKL